MSFDNGVTQYRFQDLLDAGLLQIGDGYRAKNRELGGSGLIFLRAGHVTDTHISFEGVDRFHADLNGVLENKMAASGDTVVTTKGNSVGRTTFVTDDMPPFVYSPHLSFWRSLDHRKLAPGFLRYWSVGPEFVAQLEGLKNQTDMAPYLSLRDQRRLRISLPAPAVQHAIGRILGTLDDKIELNRVMNATLEEIARALFKSWFVDFDPVTAKVAGRQPAHMSAATAAHFPGRFVDSDLGSIPKGWRVGSVEEFIDGLFDGPHATPRPSDSGPIFLGIKNLTGTQIDLSNIRHISEEDWPRWTRRIEPRDDDIVFTYEATIGFFALVPPDVRCCLGRRLALIRPKSQSKYLFHWFTASPFQDVLDSRTVQGSTVPRTSLLEFPRYPVLVPPTPLVDAFCRVATRLWDQIHLNQAETRNLEATRNALLPQLLTGKIRLRQAEKQIQEAV